MKPACSKYIQPWKKNVLLEKIQLAPNRGQFALTRIKNRRQLSRDITAVNYNNYAEKSEEKKSF
jgi:hypothetical protein